MCMSVTCHRPAFTCAQGAGDAVGNTDAEPPARFHKVLMPGILYLLIILFMVHLSLLEGTKRRARRGQDIC